MQDKPPLRTGVGNRTRRRATMRAPRQVPSNWEQLLQRRAIQINNSEEPIHVTPQMRRLEKRRERAQTAEREVRNAAPLAEFHTDLILQK